MENVLDLIAGGIIVAGIVSSNAKKLARVGWAIFKQKEHCTYLRCLTCYNPSTLTKTNKIPTKVGTSVRSRYCTKCDDLRDECPDCWTLRMWFDPVSYNTHKGCLCLVNRPKICCCWDVARIFILEVFVQTTRLRRINKLTWILLLRFWRKSMKELWMKVNMLWLEGMSALLAFGCIVTKQFLNAGLLATARLCQTM